MGLALGALAGVLSGLAGVPKGMNEATQADQRQQQIDELRRHNQMTEQASMTDVDQLYGVLGVPKPPGMGGGKVNTSTANLLATRMLADQERQRKTALGTQLGQQMEAQATTTSMAPGASIEMPQPGSLMTPPPAGPAPAISERRVNPDVAALAKIMPMLSQLDPGKATDLAAEQYKIRPPIVVPKDARAISGTTGAPFGAPPGPPRPKVDIRSGAGDSYAISTDPETGEPIGKPRPLGIGATESKAVYTRADIENELKLKGLQPGTLAYQEAYNNKARWMMVPQGGGVVGAGDIPVPPPSSPPPPSTSPSSVPNASPQGNALRMKAAETTDPAQKANLLAAAVAADRAASAAGPASPTAPGGSPRMMIERAPSAADAAHYVHKTTLNAPPAGMTLSQIQGSNEYINVGQSAQGAVKQYRTVKTMLDEAERIIRARSDLFPENTGQGGMVGGVLDNAKVAQAWAKFKSGAKTDADIGRIDALKIALPTAIKAFGDTANVAVAEREIANTALGLGPSTRDAALGRINMIRELANAGATSAGFPNLMTAPAAGTENGGAKDVRIRDRKTGKTGTMTLQPGEQVPAHLEVVR